MTMEMETNMNIDYSRFSLPQVPDQSLYKADPKRINPASRIHTRPGKGTFLGTRL